MNGLSVSVSLCNAFEENSHEVVRLFTQGKMTSLNNFKCTLLEMPYCTIYRFPTRDAQISCKLSVIRTDSDIFHYLHLYLYPARDIFIICICICIWPAKCLQIMNSMKFVIPLHSLYWSIHTKDENKRGTAFAFIFGVN